MEQYVGIDVSLELSSVCVVDASGKILRELKVPSEPEALVQFIQHLEPAPVRIGLEAGPLSQWLFAGLVSAGLDVVLLETRHVKAALSAMPVKTDRKDARGIAQMVRMGWYRPVHCKAEHPDGNSDPSGFRATQPLQDVRTFFRNLPLKALESDPQNAFTAVFASHLALTLPPWASTVTPPWKLDMIVDHQGP